MISKDAGHRHSRACDGSSDLMRELSLHLIKQAFVVAAWLLQRRADSWQVKLFFKLHDEFNDIE